MWSKLEETLRCSVCQDVFQRPVFLTCRHSFCKSCLQEWWSQNRRPECPLCRTVSPEWDPPLNMALQNVCEAFSQQKAECQLLSPPKGQTPVNPVARTSTTPRLHRLVPREIQEHFSYELELFGDVKGNYGEVADDIEVQAKVAERQIEDVFATLKRMLKREKQARISAVKEEKAEKKQRMKRLMEILDDAEGLSEKTPLDLTFWQGYRKTARKVPAHLPELPQLLAAVRLDVDQHVNNLPCRVLDSMKNQLSSQQLNPETTSSGTK